MTNYEYLRSISAPRLAIILGNVADSNPKEEEYILGRSLIKNWKWMWGDWWGGGGGFFLGDENWVGVGEKEKL